MIDLNDVYTFFARIPSVSHHQNGTEVSFDVPRDGKAVISVDLKLYKRSVSWEALLRSINCSNNYSVQLTVFTGAANLQRVTTIVLAGKDLVDSNWVGFHGLENAFKSSLKQNLASKFKVNIVALSICSNRLVDLQELGFFAEEEETVLLVVYLRNPGNSILMHFMAKEAARPRRHVEMEMISSGSSDQTSPAMFDPTKACTLVKYNVSMHEI